MNKIIVWVIGAVAIIALIISIGNSVGGSNQSVLRGVTNYDSLTLSENLIVGGTITSAGKVTITTANTATSTLIVGCLQMYATSTATAGKMTFTSASTTGATGASFIPSWTYGTCP